MTPEFAGQLGRISAEIRRQVGVLLTRGGDVDCVVVGDREAIQLPHPGRSRSDQRRFRGVRCVHTHLGEAGLSRDDLNDLSLLRLDTMTALEVDEEGRPGRVHTAHLSPDFQPGEDRPLAQVWTLLPACDIHQLSLDFPAFIRDLEAEFARKTERHWRQAAGERAILVGVTTGRLEEAQERLDELEELARSADLRVLDRFIQRRPRLDPRLLLGHGKLQEIVIRSLQRDATLLIFDRNLTPSQARAICRETDLKVIDRSQLILDIFARRAKSQEGRIQVELAQLKYMMPRLAEFDDSLSRLTGGIGGRGPGETSLEVNRRRVKDRIRHLEDKLEGVCRSRRQRRARRQRHSVPVISIVGYTNAGKSTLVNALTQAGVLVEDKLFATLDPVSRRLRLSPEREVLVSDTVGFIRDLPEELVEAFRATLEEIEDSALLIHLADAASPLRDAQIAAVDNILAGIGLGDIPRLLVLNKADRLDAWHREALARRYDATVISALRGEGLDTLLETVRRRLANGKATAWAETSAVNEGENS